jgi:hypothetical protein
MDTKAAFQTHHAHFKKKRVSVKEELKIEVYGSI